MTTTRIGTPVGKGLAGLIALGIGWIGVQYVRAPAATAPSFTGSAELDPTVVLGNAKGVRDLVAGLVIGGALVSGRREVTGWAMLVGALIPTGDMLVVLRNGGTRRTAFGVHGATAVAAALGGALLLRAATGSRPTGPLRG